MSLADQVIRKGRKRVAQGPPHTILWHYVFRWVEGYPELDIIFEYGGKEYVFTERGKFWIGMWRDELYFAIWNLKRDQEDGWVRKRNFGNGGWILEFNAKKARRRSGSRLETIELLFLANGQGSLSGFTFIKTRADCIAFLKAMRKVVRQVRREAGVMAGEDTDDL